MNKEIACHHSVTHYSKEKGGVIDLWVSVICFVTFLVPNSFVSMKVLISLGVNL